MKNEKDNQLFNAMKTIITFEEMKAINSRIVEFNQADSDNDIIMPGAFSLNYIIKDSIIDENGITVIKDMEIMSASLIHSIKFEQNLKANKKLHKKNMKWLRSLIAKLYKIPWYRRIFIKFN